MEAFAASGFATLGRVLDLDRLPALRREIDGLLAGPLPAGCERANNTLVALRWCTTLVDAVLADGGTIETIRDATGATDLRFVSAYASVKEPGSGPLGWHQDWWRWSHPVSFQQPAPQVAVLVYLNDTALDAGALRVLPGSHRRAHPLHRTLPAAHSEGHDRALIGMADQADQVSLPVGAGEAVVLDYRLLHGTHANVARRRRDALLLSFAPHWSSLPAAIRGHLIQHPALPSAAEPTSARSWATELLPSYDGHRADLPLDRDPPWRGTGGTLRAEGKGTSG